MPCQPWCQTKKSQVYNAGRGGRYSRTNWLHLAGSLNRFLVNTAESTPGSPAAPQEPYKPDPVSVDIPVVALEAETAFPKDASAQPNILPKRIDLKVFTDISYWPETVDKTLKTEFVKRGTVELQNEDALFWKDNESKSFPNNLFYLNLDNGETMLKTWLVFSPVNYDAYYFPCMIFLKAKEKSYFWKPSRFNTWRKLNPRLLEHEHCSYHLSAFTLLKEVATEMRHYGCCCTACTTEVIWETESSYKQNTWLCAVSSQANLTFI